ncbi:MULTISPECIES: hypothetical protein [unclassified Pseudomonas]|jgi:hypothetical protein|uniref:hypothetical protein n=1 Tax=unclassified Pseudomonas TaxID=196821 RepID=UPI0007025DC5|nr:MULTISPECIES: hypothetical protein [unclassified Pseudomonas]KQZ91267.1 hypothetical protein ASD60_25570 [Pseudomonas sp. Root562]
MKIPKKRIANPITVIAIFATLSETSAAVILPLLDNREREIYIWFLISFPFYLLLLFFATLNFNYRSLYAPSDYEKGEHFIEALGEMDNRENEATDVPPASRSPNAQSPPDDIDSRQTAGEQRIRLSQPANSLQIIDARQLNKTIEFSALSQAIKKPREKHCQAVLFIADTESEKCLKEGALNLLKQTRKRSNATFYVVYNLCSKRVTVLESCH